MDVPMYALALVLFGVLYLVLDVFLLYTLLICLIVIYLYMVMRYDKLPESYPYGAADTTILAIFIGATWGIFTFLGPKPVEFVSTTGQGFYYATTSIPWSTVLTLTIVASVGFMVVGALILPRLGEGSVGKGGTAANTSSLVPTK